MSVVAGGDPNGAFKADKTPVDQPKPITVKQLEPFLGRPAKGVCGWGMGPRVDWVWIGPPFGL